MSAILLGRKLLENPFESEEIETHKKVPKKDEKDEKDEKEQTIEGKNKTYIISKTLGKGTFGKVKIAYNKENKNEKYACKILLKSNIKDEDDYIRCKREMDILKKMHHVNVVRTYEIISTETTYYIFMDFCPKGELFNYIVEKQHLNEDISAFFYYQMINGIEYIHKKGVCHRDLKPENLLLTEKYKLKIIDFGLSNYFKGNLLETPCGSPCYASPEMVMGNKYDGFCIDIWSSGIILYAMMCGYLPFEEMENDYYNEVLFNNIVQCKVEYPNEFITPVAKDLLCKILVKDPKKRITIEEIKNHNFYLLGELLYKQTFETLGSYNEYLLLLNNNDNDNDNDNEYDIFKDNDNDKYFNFNDLNDNEFEEILLNNNINFGEIFLKKYEKEIKKINDEIKKEQNVDKSENYENIQLTETNKKDNFKDKNKDKDKDRDNNIILLCSEKKEGENKNKKKANNDIIDKINDKITYQNNNVEKTPKKSEKEKEIEKSYRTNNNNSNANTISNNKKIECSDNKSSKKQKSKELCNSPKDEHKHVHKKPSKKQLSLETYHNIKLPLNTNYNNYKGNILQKTNKEKSLKEYSMQEEHINGYKNSNEINFKNQYLKTEIYPSYLKNKSKTKKGQCQCKLLNKKLLNSNFIAFDNILKSLQNQNNNIIKNKTSKKHATKKYIQMKQINNKSNSIKRKKNSSYSPGIRTVSKDRISNIEKNINFTKQNNFPYPLVTHNNNNKIKNSYNLLSDSIMKNLNSKLFFFNNFEYKNKNNNKNFRQNKKFKHKKNDKNININSINKDNYFRTNIKNYNKNNNNKKLLKSSMNNALNIKSFDFNISSNHSKKKHFMVDKKINNDINKTNYTYYLLTNNFNNIKTTKNNISKKTFYDLKGNNYLKNIFSNNTKPVLINTSHVRKSTEIVKNNKIINTKFNNNNKSRTNSNKNSKSKSKNKKNYLLSHKKNYFYNKNNIDNNIIINFNILKPNIILDHRRATSRKTKNNRLSLNQNMVGTHNNNINNYFSSKNERPMTEGNYMSSVRNIIFNKRYKNKNNNYKNFDMKQINKSKEYKNIIKSIHEMKKIQCNNTNNNNNQKRMNTEL